MSGHEAKLREKLLLKEEELHKMRSRQQVLRYGRVFKHRLTLGRLCAPPPGIISFVQSPVKTFRSDAEAAD